jgi:hypothetical protein
MLYQRLRNKKLLPRRAEKIGCVDAFVYLALSGGVYRMLVMDKKSRNTHNTTITKHVTAIIHIDEILPF